MVATHSCVLSIGSALCLGRSRASDSHLEPTNGRTLLCVGRDDGVATHQSGIEPGIPKPYPDGGAFRQRSVGIVSYSSMRLCCVWLFVLLTGLLLLFPSWLVGSNKKQYKKKQFKTIQFNNSHVISPEISLYNARIVYQWNIRLDSGSIRTQVDPTSAVHVTWTDKSMTGNWVTDFRLPLAGTTLSALAADVRVRRQFSF